MRLNKLLDLGASYTEPLVFGKSRPKASGYMWQGRATVELNGIKFYFELHYHGPDEMTEEEVKKVISLKGVCYDNGYYDVYWYTILTEDSIWLLKEGWFRDERIKKRSPLICNKGNYNFQRDTLSDEDEEELVRLGFIRLSLVA